MDILLRADGVLSMRSKAGKIHFIMAATHHFTYA